MGPVADIVLFAPLGLALSLGEALPELARKGRERLGPQFRSARAVGQLAVGQARHKAMSLFPALPSLGGLPGLGGLGGLFGPRTGARQWATYSGPVAPASGGAPSASARGQATVVRKAPDVESVAGHQPGAGRGSADLAIPSYDALSASQVVQRLAGLSRDEVTAVRAYEAATRARRTVLARADQLLL